MPIAPFVPDELRFMPFRGIDARDRRLLTKAQLESRVWLRLLRDVYVHRDVPVTFETRVAAAALVAGGHVLAGRTAAWLHGIWTPPPGSVVPIDLARPRDASGATLTGVRRSRRVWRASDEDVVDLGDLRVLSPMRTCFDLTRERQLVEAVVVLDAFAHAEAFSVEDFAAYAAAHRRWPGVRTAKRAAFHADAGAASSGETRTRMVVVLSGFERPVVQAEIVLPWGSRFLDLLLVRVPNPVGIEYDGAHHREEGQRRSDLRRENAILAGTRISLLRYDAYSLACERDLMQHELVVTSGFTGARPLLHRHFYRGPLENRW